MLKKRFFAIFVPIICIACLLCSCTVDITAEKYFDFAETKELTFYLDDDTYYFPTDRLDTIYFDDLSEIDASTTSIHDVVIISNLDYDYSFSDSDISGIDTMFEQGAMVCFVEFQRTVIEKYESAFISMNIEKSDYYDLGEICLFYRYNGKMMKKWFSTAQGENIHNYLDGIWRQILDSIVGMYKEMGYVK